MRSLMNFFGGLRIQSLNPLMAGVLVFASVLGIVAHLDAQTLQFTEKGTYTVGEGVQGIATGDLDNDGLIDDVAIREKGTSDLKVYYGNEGELSATMYDFVFSMSGVGDINSDGLCNDMIVSLKGVEMRVG